MRLENSLPPTHALDLSGAWCRVAKVADLVNYLCRLSFIDNQDDLDIVAELCNRAGVEWDMEGDFGPWELAEKAAGKFGLSIYNNGADY